MAAPSSSCSTKPSLGLAPIMVQEVGKDHPGHQPGRVTMLLIEQNAQMALRLANRGYVLETGAIAIEEPPRNSNRTTRSARPTWAFDFPPPPHASPRRFDKIQTAEIGGPGDALPCPGIQSISRPLGEK